MTVLSTSPDPATSGLEPVAVIGVGCRLPGGVGSPEEFWELLDAGTTTAGEVPPGRWDYYRELGAQYETAVRRAVGAGNFLRDIEEFDAAFFGIAPREAALMDPQQRLLLEVAWEALEHAGVSPRGLAGTDAGVFVGVCTGDYGGRILEDLPTIEAWTGIGAATCAVANRLSHVLDLRGASVAVDTACSASLVAVHLATQSLRLGESTMALAAGVNLIVSPGQTLTLDAAGALSPDGRSKPFDASADGYGRGEGCGVLVLKKLSDARRDGDRVLAVVRGSAVNQDGRTPGIMAPCGAAQEHVMVRACEFAGVDPGTVDYVEAHGTGTTAGDPMEIAALNAVYGAHRSADDPCLIGSVKANIGHLEGAAGVAGVIKAVLALHHGAIPATPIATGLNPDIPWDGFPLRVVTELTPWPTTDSPRRAGVSGFGYGGTVAHVVLEEAPAPSEPAAVVNGTESDQYRLYPVSAASGPALHELAGRIADRITAHESVPSVGDVAHTLALRRAHLAERAVVVATGRKDLAFKLRALADGRRDEDVATGSARPRGEGPVWVFSGHGSQWVGMGRELLEKPPFAAVIDRIDPIFRAEIGFSPREALLHDDLTAVDRVQTLIFAMQVGLAETWRCHGVRPAAVIGHSVGEIAAAVVAGALGLDDGARLICRRSVLLRRAAGRGAMLMVTLPFDEVRRRLDGRHDVVAAIAASTAATVVAGEPTAIAELAERWPTEGVGVRRIASDVAFHSPHMDPLLADLTAAARDLTHRPLLVPMYSTSLGDPRAAAAADAAYWAGNLRNPVRLTAAVDAALEDGHQAFLETSPHPVVAHSLSETLADRGREEVFVGSTLRRGRSEEPTFLAALGALHCAGVELDWPLLAPPGTPADLPATAWQHVRHWHGSGSVRGSGRGHDPGSHTLLGAPTSAAGSSLRLWQTSLEDADRPYPGSHTLNDVEIVPAAVLVETFRAAAPGAALTDLVMRHPLMTADRREVQVVLDGGSVRLASRSPGGGPDEDRQWLVHAQAERVDPAALPPLPTHLPDASAHRLLPVDPSLVHQRLAEVGVPDTGFDWTVEELLYGRGRLRAAVHVPHPGDRTPTWAPVVDAVMSIAPAGFEGAPVLRMVVHVDDAVTAGDPPDRVLIEIVRDPARDDVVDALVADADGRVVARFSGLRYPVIGGGTAGTGSPARLVHEVRWRPLEVPAATTRPVVVLLGTATATIRPLQTALLARGVDCHVAAGTAELLHLAVELQGRVEVSDVLVVPPAAEPSGSAAALVSGVVRIVEESVRRLSVVGGGRPRLWCVTSGVREAATDAVLAQGTAWGLVRALRAGYPGVLSGVIDLPVAGVDTVTDRLVDVLVAAPVADVVALAGDDVLTSVAVRSDGAPAGAPVRCRPDGTYLVGGGLGERGLDAAQWLVRLGARRIVLADRRPLPARSGWGAGELAPDVRARVERVRALEAQGVSVRVLDVDVADVRQLTEALHPDVLGLPPVRGAVHVAETVERADADADLRAGAVRAAVNGAWALHTVLPPGSVDFLVLLTGADHVVGSPDRVAASAAGGFLDMLAARRRATGCPGTVAVAWPSRDGHGVLAVEDADAFDALSGVTARGSGCYALLRPAPDAAPAPPLLRELAAGEEPAEDPGVPGWDAERVEALSPGELRDRVLAEVRELIAAEMGLPVESLDPRRPLLEQGLDSVMTVVVRRRLERLFGRQLAATVFWQQPTALAIADHLTSLLTDSG